MSWISLQVPAIGSLDAPVYVRVQDIPPHHRFPAHRHRWHQLIYSISGSLTVAVEHQRFVCGPEQAVWIPIGTVHEVASTYGAKFRSLYVRRTTEVAMPARHVVVEVTPLMRELILEASHLGSSDDRTYRQRVLHLILSHLPRLSRVDMSLPWPATEILRRLCEELYRSPANEDDISAWGDRLGASGRTLTRRFQAETGMTFRNWKRRMRLVKALELLGAGMNVTTTALELGYHSTSAFSFMFANEMGYSPKEHRVARSGPDSRQSSRNSS